MIDFPLKVLLWHGLLAIFLIKKELKWPDRNLTTTFRLDQGHLRRHEYLSFRDIQIVKELSVLRGAFLLPAHHPDIHTPPAATSWASCLFAVDRFSLINQTKVSTKKFVYLNLFGLDIKKPALAGLGA